jgi:hypothetical protein
VGTRPRRTSRYLDAMAPIETPPPDPDGRPHIWAVFDFGYAPELDLASSIGSIKKQQLELSEGLGVVLFDDDGDVWCSSTRSWIGSIHNAVAGSCAWIGRRFAALQSPGSGHRAPGRPHSPACGAPCQVYAVGALSADRESGYTAERTPR